MKIHNHNGARLLSAYQVSDTVLRALHGLIHLILIITITVGILFDPLVYRLENRSTKSLHNLVTQLVNGRLDSNLGTLVPEFLFLPNTLLSITFPVLYPIL